MPNTIIVGTQWGDEGKAKVIDYLTEKSDVIIRFHGGANAGYTVISNNQKFVFHLVPSGIIYPNKISNYKIIFITYFFNILSKQTFVARFNLFNNLF